MCGLSRSRTSCCRTSPGKRAALSPTSFDGRLSGLFLYPQRPQLGTLRHVTCPNAPGYSSQTMARTKGSAGYYLVRLGMGRRQCKSAASELVGKEPPGWPGEEGTRGLTAEHEDIRVIGTSLPRVIESAGGVLLLGTYQAYFVEQAGVVRLVCVETTALDAARRAAEEDVVRRTVRGGGTLLVTDLRPACRVTEPQLEHTYRSTGRQGSLMFRLSSSCTSAHAAPPSRKMNRLLSPQGQTSSRVGPRSFMASSRSQEAGRRQRSTGS